MRRAAVVLALLTGCSVEPINLAGKPCPCDDGFICDSTTRTCVLPGSSDGGAGDSGSDGATGGSGGATGGSGGATGGSGGATGGSGGATGGSGGATGGTGGCLSTQKLCNGSCVSKTSPSTGCAATSCSACPTFENANTICSSGACKPSCKTGFGNCNGVDSDGCEQTVSDAANCGACGRTCSSTGASATACVSAKCAPTCQSGRADCTTPSASLPDNGCETTLATSSSHCGVCGNSCSSIQVGFSCQGGSCGCDSNADCASSPSVTGTCAAGICSCGGTPCNGGEVCIKQGNNTFCSCKGGAACTAGQICCGSGCVSPQTDAANCGGCERACATGQSCVAGVCV